MRFRDVQWEQPEERELFLEEARELLDTLETEALADRPAIDVLFRAAHTLKGSGGMIGLDQWVQVAHGLEEQLDAVRQGERAYDEAVKTAVLRTVDALRRELEGDEPNAVSSARLRSWTVYLDPTCPMPGVRAYQAEQAVAERIPGARLAIDAHELAHWAGLEIPLLIPADAKSEVVRQALESVADVVRVEAPPEEGPAPASEASTASSGRESTVRIGVETIERLLETIGELLLDQAQLEHQLGTVSDPAVRSLLTHLRRKALDLQETTLKARMLPLDRLFRQYPRAVHDMAAKLGKSIRLETRGGETELDRLVMDSLHEPLLHLLRNACDHGIEPPAERQALGKAATGTIRLEAYAAEGHVHIRIQDDGRGINWQAVRRKAVEQRWLSAEEAEAASPATLADYLFRPGLSTAERITDLSGRGVGLDAVRAFLDQVHGTVTVESEPGRGTTFHLELPMTMAILTALLVEAGPYTLGLPIGVVERIEERQAVPVGSVLGHPAVADGEDPVACYHLEELLDPERRARDGQYLVRVRDGRTRAALIVDRVLGQQEVVVKPVASLAALSPWMTGVALLGDGRLSFMLDVRRVVPATAAERRETAEDTTLRAGSNQMELLVFRLGDGQRYGINVYKTREVVVAPAITRVPGQHPWLSGFARLRGQTVPVVDLHQALGLPAPEQCELMLITEFSRTVQAFTVPEVERMLRVGWDEVEPLPTLLGAQEPDRRRLTGLIDHPEWGPIQLIDFEQILAEVMPPSYPPPAEPKGLVAGKTVWLADDSAVAIRQVEKALEPLGLVVRTFADGGAVWDAIAQGEGPPDLFVLDVEMPRLDGYTLTQRLKSQARTARVPVLLHTSLSGHWHQERSLSVEADAIVTKFDPALLARTVAGLLLPSPTRAPEEVPA